MRCLFYVELRKCSHTGVTEGHLHVPGRNPGTSTKVMIGTLNASQKRTNRAPLTEALMSKQPAVQKQMIQQCGRVIWAPDVRSGGLVSSPTLITKLECFLLKKTYFSSSVVLGNNQSSSHQLGFLNPLYIYLLDSCIFPVNQLGVAASALTMTINIHLTLEDHLPHLKITSQCLFPDIIESTNESEKEGMKYILQ